MTELQKKFGARVRELRKRRGLTQEQLSEMLDIGVRSLGKIETGKSFPSCETLEKLFWALNTSSVELFNFEHLQPQKDLLSLIIDMLDAHPDKIPDVYKIIKAITS